MRSKIYIIIVILFSGLQALAQNGFIRGTVFDATNGEYLPGVTVLVEGTTTGTITDLDGKFNIPVEPGVYTLQLSFISYETLKIQDIEVKAGEAHVLDDIALSEASIELTEVTVTAEAVRNTENALMTIKQKSANVIDGISASGFRKIGDSDAAASMKRVTGVSVEGGKYVYVRGLGDRYTKTILNGMDIPGLDPDRNTLQMDLFPTNVIDNIIVHKTFSAYLPADFTGGVIDIETKDFPDEKTGSISASLGYNPAMHFNPDYLTYEGGKTDFLGFDDGTRDIPATDNIPLFAEVVGNPNGPRAQRYLEILHNFNPTMSAYKETSFMDFDLGASFGNQVGVKKRTFGYNVSLSYKNHTEFYDNAEFGVYGLGDPNQYEMDRREYQTGSFGSNNVLISGLVGLALKSQNSKYRLNLMHLQNGESRAGIFDYTSTDEGSEFVAFQHTLDYSQRSLSNLLLSGEHTFGDSPWGLNWKVSPTLSKISDPDIRFVRYEYLNNGNYGIGTETGFPERVWRELTEFNIGGKADVTRDFTFLDQKSELMFGGAYTYKERDYIIRNFALNIRDIPLTGDPNELFWEDNLWPYNNNVNQGTTFEAPFIKDGVSNNPNEFNANSSNMAGYVSAELGLITNLKAIIGVRVENYIQRYTGQNQQRTQVLDNDKVMDDFDVFPAVNLIYAITEKQNLRFSFSQTIARPSFKELSFAEIYDPITSRTFIGGLNPDFITENGGIDTVFFWDGNLVSTNINNFDLRWEWFGKNGQMLSFSGFYKQFDNPIEIVQYATQTGSFQPRNVGDSEVYGAEAEFRFSFGTLTDQLKNLQLIFNYTYTNARIKMSKTEYESRLLNAREGESIDEYRDMAGQAPYLVNSGLSYNGGEKGFARNLEAGLYYNIQGQTLQFVGINDNPDIYTVPFNSLNLNVNKRFGKDTRWLIGIKVENILNDSKELVYKSYNATDQYFEKLQPGIKFKLRFSYSLF